jgi:hypothetical protein
MKIFIGSKFLQALAGWRVCLLACLPACWQASRESLGQQESRRQGRSLFITFAYNIVNRPIDNLIVFRLYF